MNWTKTQPTEPGIYWGRYQIPKTGAVSHFVVTLRRDEFDGLLYDESDGQGDEAPEPISSCMNPDVEWWPKPLTPPPAAGG